MRKRFSRFLALLFLPAIGAFIIRVLHYTNKIVYHGPDAIEDKPYLIACWHGELLMIPYFYKRYRTKPHAKAMISPHFDGKLIAATLSKFSIGNLSGSSDKNPAKVLIQAIRLLKDGYDIGLTPDGPKGPRHEVADGVVAIAKKTDAKILLVEIKPTKYWQLNSWDRFKIPKPFGTIHYYTSEALDISGLDFEEARDLIKEGLLTHEH